MEFLPPVKDAVKMTFSERNKLGFKMGLKRGIEFFFGVGERRHLRQPQPVLHGRQILLRFFRQPAGWPIPLRLLRLAAAKAGKGASLKPPICKLKGFM